MTNYQRIAKALQFINDNFTEQPNLEEVANHIHLSPYHFHRLFREWAGVTPKDFLQYISLDRAKKLLHKNQTIEKTTYDIGLSSSSRLHDLFVNIEGMTPGEYKKGGRALKMRFQFIESPFGTLLIASTNKGICNLLFVETEKEGLKELKQTWPNADLIEGQNQQVENLEKIFSANWQNLESIKLHVKGTDFQIKVWEALLNIPVSNLATYSEIASKIGNPNASRAVGTALANNPVGYLIPCHRVIKKIGGIGKYRWGHIRKKAIIGWETAQLSIEKNN